MRAWTDYPITALGDEPYKEAPIRECRVLSYDGNKYAWVDVEGALVEIKSGYLYRRFGRFGDVPHLRRIDLLRLAAPRCQKCVRRAKRHHHRCPRRARSTP